MCVCEGLNGTNSNEGVCIYSTPYILFSCKGFQSDLHADSPLYSLQTARDTVVAEKLQH